LAGKATEAEKVPVTYSAVYLVSEPGLVMSNTSAKG